MHSHYPHSIYDTNLIEIAEPFPVQSIPPTHSLLAVHHPEQFSTDSVYKKRKLERACDACRRRKTKCDGPRMRDNICTNLKLQSLEVLRRPTSPAWKDRSEKMEALLKRLRPEADFSEELGPPVVRDSWKTDPEPLPHNSPQEKSASPPASSFRSKTSPSRSLQSNVPPSASATWRTSRSDSDLSSDTSSESEEVGELSLSRGMKRLTVRGLEPTQDQCSLRDNQVRFHGKSSFFKLIEPTRKLRDEHVNSFTGGEERSRSSRDSTSPINAAALRRPQFWATPSWELAFEGFQNRLEDISFSLAEEFPPQDLADSLIDLYFANVNVYIPLFHRPTFERQWRDGLQHKDAWFGCLCLSLFAVAKPLERRLPVYSMMVANMSFLLRNGPLRNISGSALAGDSLTQPLLLKSTDVHRGSLSLFHPPGLFEVQTMALLGMFLRGTAFHPVAWLFISVGLRKAQDVGAHRKKIYGDRPSIEGELWKRAFWVLVLQDRIASASLGRPCCSGEEEFDVELPLEVDDEYWETDDPEKVFRQPPGKPSKIAAFNSHLKLTKIVAYAMRTIYALDRSKLLFSAARPRWQEVLAQLNHAMTEWVESVPKHLRWSPHIEDPLFSQQSATLYITYYLIQIIIYRPFYRRLSTLLQTSPHILTCPSPVLDRGYSNIPTLISGSHVCAAILLMNFWDLKWQERNLMRCDAFADVKSPLALAMAELLEDISVFIEALEAVKPRWRNAEMYLNDLGSSLPHSLGGFEPNIPKNDPLSRHYSSRFDDSVYHSADYTTFRDHRNPGALPPIATYTYDTHVEPSEPSPHFFEFPHITRYPVPSTLPLPSSTVQDQGDQSVSRFRPQQSYDRLPILSEFGDRSSSSSSIRSRPISLFDERIMDETSTAQHDSSVSRPFAVGTCTSYSGSVPTHQSTSSNFAPSQPRLGWASDWNTNPTFAYGPDPDNAAFEPGLVSRDEETRSSHVQALSFPGRF
ncbi:fungal-specific transcription factor domain-containing protein [Chiua virens]|nr:fungal-specific transcription factor domain-containing protein [Chiua virens]